MNSKTKNIASDKGKQQQQQRKSDRKEQTNETNNQFKGVKR